MPTIPDNIPASLRSILEDRHFMDCENAVVRAVLAEPANAQRRFEAGRMYEKFGLLCPALQAYQQVQTLAPGHDQAAKAVKRLTDMGVSPEDDEGLYQLPPLGVATDRGPDALANLNENILAIVRIGMIDDLSQVPLKKGDHDRHYTVTAISTQRIVLEARDGSLWYMGIAGVCGVAVTTALLGLFIYQFLTETGSLQIVPVYWSILGLGVSITSIGAFAMLGCKVTLHADGTSVIHRPLASSERWTMREGGGVVFELIPQQLQKNACCRITLIDPEQHNAHEFRVVKQESNDASFQVRLAAAIAAIYGVPLHITGSLRLSNSALRTTLQQISKAMTPLLHGAPA